MEKINAEELKTELACEALSDDELENVTGGMMTLKYCESQCDRKFPGLFQWAEKNRCKLQCKEEFRG